jgi:integrase/recombinase XerD
MSDRSASPSFASLLQRFFVEHLIEHRNVSPRTIAAYRDTFRLLLSFAELHTNTPITQFSLIDLNAKFLLAFLKHIEVERKNRTRSRNARLAAVRSFLRYAAHHDLSALRVIEQALAVPMKRFDRPLIGFLSRDEIHAVLRGPASDNWIGQRDRVLFATLYNTGARVSELANLRFRDVILEGTPLVHIEGKGRKQRSVPLWRTTADLLRSWKRRLPRTSDNDYLFPNRSGTAMTRSNIAQRLDAAVCAASKSHPSLAQRSISPHTIRHTTAMHLLQSGVDVSVIALWLGHESPATTHMYVEADLTMKERALNRLKPDTRRSPDIEPLVSCFNFSRVCELCAAMESAVLGPA